jgi:polyisoprenyl-phosphate glycosyltransferase
MVGTMALRQQKSRFCQRAHEVQEMVTTTTDLKSGLSDGTRREGASTAKGPAPRKSLSIVVPMYNEIDNITALVERMTELRAENSQLDIDFVVVDDGSSDGSGDMLRSLCPHPWLSIVTFSRNFGAHSALSAGFRAARGDAVSMMGADLQEPASLLPALITEWENGGDVIWAVREQRAAGSFLSHKLPQLFWGLIHRFSTLSNYPVEGPSIVFCDRRAVDAVNEMSESNRSFILLIAWVGFRQRVVRFVQDPRQAGSSKWSSRKLIKIAMDSLVQFSTSPIRLMSYLGTSVAGIGFLYAMFLMIRALFFARGPAGWTTAVVVVLILGGLQLLMLGMLGEYLWRGTDEARRRPLFIVDAGRSHLQEAQKQSLLLDIPGAHSNSGASILNDGVNPGGGQRLTRVPAGDQIGGRV